MRAKFSAERTDKYEDDWDLVSSGGIPFPLKSSQYSTDETVIFVWSECNNLKNYNADALHERRL